MDTLELGNLCSYIFPTPVEDGFRNRAKFKIYDKNDNIRIMGTDPIEGEVPAKKSLWILPKWGRKCVRDVYEIISYNYKAYPVNGFEIQLTFGRKNCFVILSVKKGASGFYLELAKTLIENIFSRDDLIILNPPRQGLSPVVIETIASQRPHTICLVSCFLETFLRDLKFWRKSGYSIRSIEAFDMFPFTDFLETVTVLEF